MISGVVLAQNTVNNYEYVIVPSKFSFARQKDEFRLNTLTKLLLEKYGFKAYFDNEQPAEIADSNCNKLYADVDSKGGFLATKVRIILKDCKNKVLYTSDEGTSREKDWGKAYNMAIRQAFESFSELHYKYNPTAISGNAQPEKTVVETVVLNDKMGDASTLYAQPVKNGFQLVDATPKIVMTLFKTADSNRFTAVKGEVHGDLVLKNGQWYFEYFENDRVVSEKIEVKF